MPQNNSNLGRNFRMKKKIAAALAATFALGVTSAFANNPFVDVPAKHWAYDSVSKLAKAGIVDGYGDGTFRGQQNMTRYEMAQIVAKAMTKMDKADAEQKAMINKLSAEFSSELNNLGVRVGNLEKKVGTVKFGGDARVRYVNKDTNDSDFHQRVRLVGQGDINENTSVYLRWMVLNHNEFGTYDAGPAQTTNVMSDAYITHKGLMKNVDAKLGRYSLNLGQTSYFAGTTGMVDGAELKYTNGKMSLTGAYADTNAIGQAYYDPASPGAFNNAGNVYYADLNYAFDNNLKANAFYIKNQDEAGAGSNLVNVFGIGTTWKFAQDWQFVGDYWKNTASDAKVNGNSPKGQVYRIAYKGAKASTPGSWGAHVEYLKVEKNAVDGSWSAAMVPVTNVKGYAFQYSNTLSKNVVADVIYAFNLKNALTGADYASGKKYTRLQINYMF